MLIFSKSKLEYAYKCYAYKKRVYHVVERLIAKQINSFMEPHLSQKPYGFRKGLYSTQHALLNLLRSWQNSLGNSLKVVALLMDLSKAFDSLPYDLLVAKLDACGFLMF